MRDDCGLKERSKEMMNKIKMHKEELIALRNGFENSAERLMNTGKELEILNGSLKRKNAKASVM